jgi:hypothetical protein
VTTTETPTSLPLDRAASVDVADVALPGVPETLIDDAAYFAENNALFWKAIYRLRSWCAAHGPITLADGRRVGLFASGTDYDADAIAEIAPALVSHMTLALDGTVPEIERAMSLVLEEVPALAWAIKRTIDKPALEGMIREGGETAERLKATKTAKAKLSVRS